MNDPSGMAVSRLWVVVLYMAWWVGIAWVYGTSFSDRWGSRAFASDWEWARAWPAIGVVLAVACLLPTSIRVTTATAHASVALIVVPTASLFAFGAVSGDVLVHTLVAVSVLVLLMSLLRIRLGAAPVQLNAETGVLIATILSVCVIAASVGILGVAAINFDVSEVYEYRSVVKSEAPWWLHYAWSATGKVLLPLIMVYGISRRRWWMVAGALALGALLFGVSSHKSMLLVLIVPVAYVYLRVICAAPKVAILWTAIVVLVFCVASQFGFGEGAPKQLHTAASMAYRRGVLVPSVLNGGYLDVFSDPQSRQWWTGSRVGQVLELEAPIVGAPEMVGDWVTPGRGTWANAGWIGAGYAQAGVPAVLLYSVIVALYVYALDAMAVRHGIAETVSVSLVFILTILCSADTVTAMGSHGGLLLILALFVLTPIKRVRFGSEWVGCGGAKGVPG